MARSNASHSQRVYFLTLCSIVDRSQTVRSRACFDDVSVSTKRRLVEVSMSRHLPVNSVQQKSQLYSQPEMAADFDELSKIESALLIGSIKLSGAQEQARREKRLGVCIESILLLLIKSKTRCIIRYMPYLHSVLTKKMLI